MYDRQQEDEVLTLFGSGDIWQRALVLKDQSSGSLWSQMLGKAMQGQRQGQALQVIPTVLTDWKTWKQSHPLTTVMALPPMTRFYDNKYYQGRLGRFLIAMREAEQQPRAWRFDQLTHQPVLNDQFAGKPIVVVFRESNGEATIFDRQLEEETLTFETHPEGFSDRQSGSVWNPLTGVAISGPHQGKQLTAQTSIRSFFEPWDRFYPDSEYWIVDLPLFFSSQIVENVGIRCEQVSRRHIMEQYRRSMNLKDIPPGQQAEDLLDKRP